MCKVLAVTSVTDKTSDAAWTFVKQMAKEMSTGNSHGLGYAAIDEEGALFGERWHDNDQAFKLKSPYTDSEAKLMTEFQGILTKEVKYNRFGNVDTSKLRGLILHTRWATSGKQFGNTHPFVHFEKKDTALIHNGMIRNTQELEQKVSTCDSECILNAYVKVKVYDKPEAIQEMADMLQGYYACAVMSRNSEGRAFLDIFHDDQAPLHAVYVKELEAMVFSTALSDMEEVCRKQNLTIGTRFDVRPGMLLRIDPLTGKVIGTWKFKFGRKKEVYKSYTHASQDSDGVTGMNSINYKGFYYDVEKEEWASKDTLPKHT